MMYGLLAIGLSAAALLLFGSKLLIVLGFIVAVAGFAFPLGLILLVAIGALLTWRNQHHILHRGSPE